MSRSLRSHGKHKVRALRLLVCGALLLPASFALAQGASASAAAGAPASGASDDFSRADGALGPNWTPFGEGGLVISSQAVAGTAASGVTGDIWSAGSFSGDQFSQISLTSAQLAGGQWVGAAVRAGNGGLDGYAGIYFWNNGSPELLLFKRNGGSWAQLGNAYNSGALGAGVQLKVTAVGSSISFLENGVQRITATDSSVSGGSPGIVAYGTGQAGSWSGGTAAGSTFTVGGTVSGLSGSVVLQDNGGDSLSVSASGSFTFATALADGSAYSVSVATYPAGQTCTVSGGAGTISGASVTSVSVACSAGAPASGASDDFSRADGALGPNWTPFGEGGLVISSQAVAGTAASGVTGDIWSAGSFSGDQFSQISLTSAQLAGGQWVGAAVRAGNGGLDGYAGIYFWNNGSPELLLFKRNGGSWAQLGNAYNSGALGAGVQLKVTAVGSSISFLENGVQRITATDSSVSGGSPGIVAYGTGQAGSWSGGTAAGSTFTVGGTVSGLSGSVVLQDNGGDSLSVSASGSFTFATALADGSAYSVSVATYPAGQTCTVSGGAGTISGASVTSVSVACSAGAPASGASDDFSRADGALGPNWTPFGEGGLVISSQAVAGTAASGVTGDIWSAGSFSGDQFSQISLTSAQLAGGQWVGAAVRAGNGGLDGYAGIYFWNNGSPELLLFKRNGGSWAQLGNAYNSGALGAGVQLKVTAVGSSISFLENGVQRITATDSSVSGGSPGIVAYGTGQAGSWSGGTAAGSTFTVGGTVSGLSGSVVLQDNGGDSLSVSASGSFTFATALADGSAYSVSVATYPAGQTCTVSGGAGTISGASVTSVSVACSAGTGFEVQYLSSDADGVASYNVTSADDSGSPLVMRVLKPTNPAPGVAHNFLFVLPVEPGLGTTFGDGLETLRGIDAQDKYNLTIIEPSFAIDPWYANNPLNAGAQYETFMTGQLVPWVRQNLATTGSEQNWLIGFSKSGEGGQDLILKHPDIFSLAASWDFPADMGSYSAFGSSTTDAYGTDANFQANYRLTSAFLDAHKGPFLKNNRIWIGGYQVFQADMTDYDALLNSEGIVHSTETPTAMAHRWDSGWVPLALAALYHDSVNQPGTP